MSNCDIPHEYRGWAIYPHHSGLSWEAEEMYSANCDDEGRCDPATITASEPRVLHAIIDFLEGDEDEQTFQVHH